MTTAPVVFLVHVDNRPLNNERVQDDLKTHDLPELLPLEVPR